MAFFQTRRVDKSQAEATEPLGTKPKFWFRENERKLLFKAEQRGTGEDWAERVACELCLLLGLPHVDYELAQLYDGDKEVAPGIVCESFVPPNGTLVLGNELLLGLDPEYPSSETTRKYQVRQHTIDAVAEAIRQLKMPEARWTAKQPHEISGALDVFVGYVLLDAWIANQDRHHENWGAVEIHKLHLAPAFDHASSLARNLTDEEREDRLTSRDRGRSVEAFAQRARSAFYSAPTVPKPLKTLDAFEAFACSAPKAARIWQELVASVSLDTIESVIAKVPTSRMSDVAKDFTVRLLVVNQQRIKDISLQ